MKLLVDIGNSRIKWVLGSAAGFIARGVAPHDAAPGPGALLDPAYRPTEIRVANVAGRESGAGVVATLHRHYGIAPVLALSAASGAGVRSGYRDPGQLGVDRWLAVCAAFHRYRSALCVVDAGTATTIDNINAAGEHLGGLILPGVALMRSALLGATGDLARLSAGRGTGDALPGAADDILGRDTAAAIDNAAWHATVCLVRDSLARLGSPPAADSPPLLVLTGGAAPVLGAALARMTGTAGAAPLPGVRLEYRPELVLEGLALDPPCFRVAT